MLSLFAVYYNHYEFLFITISFRKYTLRLVEKSVFDQGISWYTRTTFSRLPLVNITSTYTRCNACHYICYCFFWLLSIRFFSVIVMSKYGKDSCWMVGFHYWSWKWYIAWWMLVNYMHFLLNNKNVKDNFTAFCFRFWEQYYKFMALDY